MVQKFYRCEHCGNIIAYVKNSGVPVVCCGEAMKELVPGITDASAEKHVPVYTVDSHTVTVHIGAAAHPMTDAHFIEWVSLQTRLGNQRKELHPGDAPTVSFPLADNDAVKAVYAYCNLHGLWKAE